MSTTQSQTPDRKPGPEQPELNEIIRSLVAVFPASPDQAHWPNRLGNGEVADLRRAVPGQGMRSGRGAYPPAFWRLLAQFVDPQGRLDAQGQDDWATVICGMAQMAPNHHRPDAAPGQVLAQEGYSEKRFLKLLEARGDVFHLGVTRACRYLRVKSSPVDWFAFAAFILSRDPEAAEKQRRQLAGHYFRECAKAKKEKE